MSLPAADVAVEAAGTAFSRRWDTRDVGHTVHSNAYIVLNLVQVPR